MSVDIITQANYAQQLLAVQLRDQVYLHGTGAARRVVSAADALTDHVVGSATDEALAMRLDETLDLSAFWDFIESLREVLDLVENIPLGVPLRVIRARMRLGLSAFQDLAMGDHDLGHVVSAVTSAMEATGEPAALPPPQWFRREDLLREEVPPELALCMLKVHRGVVADIVVHNALELDRSELWPWLGGALAKHYRVGRRELLRLVAAGVPTVPLDVLPAVERLDVKAIEETHAARLRWIDRNARKAAASGLPIYPPLDDVSDPG